VGFGSGEASTVASDFTGFPMPVCLDTATPKGVQSSGRVAGDTAGYRLEALARADREGFQTIVGRVGERVPLPGYREVEPRGVEPLTS